VSAREVTRVTRVRKERKERRGIEVKRGTVTVK
jgi:hypothetical protein